MREDLYSRKAYNRIFGTHNPTSCMQYFLKLILGDTSAEKKKDKEDIKLESTREEAYLSDESAMDTIIAANQFGAYMNNYFNKL